MLAKTKKGVYIPSLVLVTASLNYKVFSHRAHLSTFQPTTIIFLSLFLSVSNDKKLLGNTKDKNHAQLFLSHVSISEREIATIDYLIWSAIGGFFWGGVGG